ncbi:MAG: DUF3488 and transglutaminase-like domain-containing protein [Porticoccaceae bacterium]|nr:DUF3488 and transglutaminase-like domain-containing protein [Porticoccaceae bacterium]
MQPTWQTPRPALLWMLISVVTTLALHVRHLPLWLLGAAALTVLWQIQVYRGAWQYPAKYIKVLLTLLCFGGVLSSYGHLLGLEPMVAILVSGFSLKLLEIHHRRDALVLIYLAYFIIVIQCLFEQGIVTGLIVVLGVTIVTAALAGLYQSNHNNQTDSRGILGAWFRPFRSSAVIIMQSLPLMLVLFIVMPRVGALWAVPKEQGSGVVGVSDSMSPGDFSDLGGSSKVAFRVEFEGDIPAQSALYWRGLVFSDFDGRRWSQSGSWGYRDGSLLQWYGDKPEPWDSQATRRGDALTYQVTLEATNSPWLFALATPKPASQDVALTRDFRLYSKRPLSSKTQYRVKSWPDYNLEVSGLSSWRRKMELALPDGFNPETRAIAEQWRQESPDTVALLNRLLKLYNEEFIYTLKPPLLGKHTVDEFLWETKRGFCEFYASSFVFFARAAGIPARVVAGYQGGERHPSEDYLLVHQYDAHAWAEVWLEGRGWIRVDPTAAVAPERVEMSFADLFGENKDFLAGSLLSLERYRHINWINNLRLRLDALDYAWAKWVLGYGNMQTDLLTSILGRLDPLRVGLFLLAAGALAMLPVAVMSLLGQEKKYRDDLDKFFIQFCQRMERAGITRRPGEGPRDFAARIQSLRPDLADQVSSLTALYEQQRYNTATLDSRNLRLKELRLKLRRFRPYLRSKVT